MVSCLDPFHDYQQTTAGFPDEVSTPSYVQCHTQQINLTAPPDVGTGTWNAVVNYRGIESNSSQAYCQYPDALESRVICNSMIGGTYDNVMADPDPPGTYQVPSVDLSDLFISRSASNLLHPWDVTLGNSFGLSSKLTDGSSRVIGVGIEVHNTTADLHKQGSVVVAHYSNEPEESTVFYRYLQDLEVETGFTSYMLPIAAQVDHCPMTEGSIRAIPGSCAWEAKKGVYLIPRLRSSPKVVNNTDAFRANICSSSFYEGTGACVTAAVLCGQPTPDGIVPPCFEFPPSAQPRSAFTPAIAWFSGLSPETTLRISYRTIVEYFPFAGTANVSLAKPSPPLDFLAQTMYHEAARTAPWAVPVSMNAGGDYFKMVLGSLAGAAKKALPVLGKIGTALTGIPLSGLSDTLATLIPRDQAGPRAFPTYDVPRPPRQRQMAPPPFKVRARSQRQIQRNRTKRANN